YLVMRYRLDGVVTVIDAVNGASTLDENVESVKQVAMADRIVLTKTDLIDTPERRQELQRLRRRLGSLHPAAPGLDAAAGEVTAARLLACGLYDPDAKVPDVKRWLATEAYAAAEHDRDGEHHHEHGHGADAAGVPRRDVNRHDARIRAVTLATET